MYRYQEMFIPAISKCQILRDGFKTQPPVDRRFRPVPPGFYCSKQWQPPGTGRNRRSPGGWVLKSPLTWCCITSCCLISFLQLLKQAQSNERSPYECNHVIFAFWEKVNFLLILKIQEKHTIPDLVQIWNQRQIPRTVFL